ncbi:putative transporter [Klebsiella pneumoniae]|uniref:Putative transporter n=1 Tax=Klebsiella pneumoniae TaxID=573 RepID=A0A377UYF7_KLEPN|nr:putative transporter [Klebsiella pneumoniae]
MDTLLASSPFGLAAICKITAIVTGALAVVLGGDVVWSLVGLLVGQMLGAAVMSLHALQGPRLGLPQMILSRAQFGVFGAVVPLVLVCVMYIGFSASGTVLAGQAMAKLLNISHVAGMLIFSAIIIVIAVLGYKVIHKLGKLASIVGILAFVYMFITLLLSADLSALAHNNHFSLPTFLLAVSLSSSWQIAFCPYVSDYSRYLPRDVSATKNVVLSVFRHRIGYPNVDDARGSDSGHCRQRVPLVTR